MPNHVALTESGIAGTDTGPRSPPNAVTRSDTDDDEVGIAPAPGPRNRADPPTDTVLLSSAHPWLSGVSSRFSTTTL